MAVATGTANEWLKLLLTAEPYKPGKGAMARNGTFAAAVVVILFGLYAWSQTQGGVTLALAGPIAIGAVLTWVAFRAVHYPRFAEFLINTEAEMNKVTWPSWQELRISTAVVVTLVVMTGLFLFGTDLFWRWLLNLIGILKIGGLFGGGGSGM